MIGSADHFVDDDSFFYDNYDRNATVMDKGKIRNFLNQILNQIEDENGQAAVDRFSGLRQVDSKVREVKIFLEGVPELPKRLYEQMGTDIDFEANSRRVRLEALANYCRNALSFIDSGVVKEKVQLVRIPDISRLTQTHPRLEDVLSRRWIDAQKCRHSKCYLAAIILMGSVLEGLLLARVSMDPPSAYRSSRAPKDKTGKQIPYHDWNLSTLIDVAVEVGWLKMDRGKFGHALRESRNIVHPWAEVATNSDFDEATCATSWEVLKASTNDLLVSIA